MIHVGSDMWKCGECRRMVEIVRKHTLCTCGDAEAGHSPDCAYVLALDDVGEAHRDEADDGD